MFGVFAFGLVGNWHRVRMAVIFQLRKGIGYDIDDILNTAASGLMGSYRPS